MDMIQLKSSFLSKLCSTDLTWLDYYVFELTRNFICTNIFATEAKSQSIKTTFGWCDCRKSSGVQNINVFVCLMWMTEDSNQFEAKLLFRDKMLKHVAFWAFVFLPFSTGICAIFTWIQFPHFSYQICTIVISGLYFHIGETERKCFIEEIPDETMVTGNYKVLTFGGFNQFWWSVS